MRFHLFVLEDGFIVVDRIWWDGMDTWDWVTGKGSKAAMVSLHSQSNGQTDGRQTPRGELVDSQAHSIHSAEVCASTLLSATVGFVHKVRRSVHR